MVLFALIGHTTSSTRPIGSDIAQIARAVAWLMIVVDVARVSAIRVEEETAAQQRPRSSYLKEVTS